MMRADVSVAAPTSSFKTAMSHLRLNLQDVNGFSEDEEEEVVGRPGHGRGVPSVSLACPTTPRETNGETSDRPQSSRQRIRSQSAKRLLQNGPNRSDSPPSSKSSGFHHRPVPPKSAPSLRPKGANRGRTIRSRDQNGGAGESPERPTGSPSPQRIQAARPQPASGRRLSSRQPRRRLISRSEDLSSSSGDPQSPRLSVSDQHQQQQLQHSFNGTLSSDGSEDLRHPPGTPVGRGASGSGSGSGSTSSAWDVFEEHVRTIHDSSDLFSRYQGPSFRASCTFQETMTDLYGYPDYSHPPGPSVHTVAARGMMVAGAATRFLKLRKKSTLTGEAAAGAGVVASGKDRAPADRQTLENAKRGWRVLKEYVQENYTSKRTSQAALSWTMLRHTLKGLSDREKTRMDLYRRYGIVPTLDTDGRLVTVNTMLSERARQALANGSRHPHLVHTTTTRTPPHHPHPHHPNNTSLPAALSSNSLLSPRSSGDSSAGGIHHQRRVRSSVVRSARAETVRTSMNGSGGGMSLRNGALRNSAEFRNRSPNRSHTP